KGPRRVLAWGIPLRQAHVRRPAGRRDPHRRRAPLLPRRVARTDRRAVQPGEVLLMPVNGSLGTDMPGTGAPARGDGPSLYRVLVPVGLPGGSDKALAVAAQLSAATGGMLLLIHVRIYDSPVPGCPGLFSPETAGDAAAHLDE